MRIGVDATCWTNRRGYGRFARDILSATLELDRENQYVFFVDDDSSEFPFPERAALIRIAAQVPTVRAAAANGHRSLRDIWAGSRAISKEALDLLYFPSVYSYVPVSSDVPVLLTIHDAIPELYPEMVFSQWRSKLFWKTKVRLGRAQASLILTVSEYSRRCLAEKLGIKPSHIRVVNEAASPAFRCLPQPNGSALLARWGLPPETRFLAYVGGFSPHKNLALLVDVFSELQAQPPFLDLHLLLVGDYETDVFFSCHRQVVDQVRQLGLKRKVVFTGHLEDEDLVTLLNLAQALVLPSYCEGFGLPAVEAASCGTPAIVTTRSPLPDLLGAGVIAIEPEDRAGWLEAMGRMLSDAPLRERMRQAGLAAAARLSWKNSARQLLSIFNEVRRDRVATS